MTESLSTGHLSTIPTQWSLLRLAHGGDHEGRSTALLLFWERYGGAVYRYLLGGLRDPHAAEELHQEFALRFLRGDFRAVCPEKGRFRDYLKSALFRMVAQFYRRRQSSPRALTDAALSSLAAADEEESAAFTQMWRAELLARVWEALAEMQHRNGPPFYRVLRLRAEHPDWPSQRLADHWSAEAGAPVTAEWVRQIIHRARVRFVGLLREEVARSLQDPWPGQVEEELSALGLLHYCRLESRRGCPAEPASSTGG